MAVGRCWRDRQSVGPAVGRSARVRRAIIWGGDRGDVSAVVGRGMVLGVIDLRGVGSPRQRNVRRKGDFATGDAIAFLPGAEVGDATGRRA